MWLLSDVGEGQYYKFIPDQAVEAMGIANYAASDLFNSSVFALWGPCVYCFKG